MWMHQVKHLRSSHYWLLLYLFVGYILWARVCRRRKGVDRVRVCGVCGNVCTIMFIIYGHRLSVTRKSQKNTHHHTQYDKETYSTCLTCTCKVQWYWENNHNHLGGCVVCVGVYWILSQPQQFINSRIVENTTKLNEIPIGLRINRRLIYFTSYSICRITNKLRIYKWYIMRSHRRKWKKLWRNENVK